MSTSQMAYLCEFKIALINNNVLNFYALVYVRPRELCRLEIALKIIITVPAIMFSNFMYGIAALIN